MGSSAGAVWAAASTAFSALLYLFDMGTTISALVTYYHYQYSCDATDVRWISSATVTSMDSICRSNFYGFQRTFMVFWLALSILAVAHITYAFIFWVTLDPSQHPLRLAYFMPLIHFYRLFQVLWRTCSFKGLTELQEGQKESSSLYSVLGASLETAPQFVAQFHLVMKLEQTLVVTPLGEPYEVQALRIPNNLILSLVASAMSCTYSTSMAVLFLIQEQNIPLPRKACVGILAGLQALAVMLLQATLAVALSQLSLGWSKTLWIYITMTLIMAWSFSTILIRSSYSDWQGINKFLNVAHSLALAYMSIFTGPIYMIVKFGKSSRWLIGATLLHVFGELIGVALVLFGHHFFRDQQHLFGQSPCHSGTLYFEGSTLDKAENKYLTCSVFLGTIVPLILTFIVTTMLFVWVHMMKCNKLNTKDMPTTSTSIACDDQNYPSSSSSATLRMVQSFKDYKQTTLRSLSTSKSKTFHL